MQKILSSTCGINTPSRYLHVRQDAGGGRMREEASLSKAPATSTAHIPLLSHHLHHTLSVMDSERQDSHFAYANDTRYPHT
jgi:hypothetical protein